MNKQTAALRTSLTRVPLRREDADNFTLHAFTLTDSGVTKLLQAFKDEGGVFLKNSGHPGNPAEIIPIDFEEVYMEEK